jgi:N-acyl-D-aspartate/D-glutamate deacylase
MYDTLITGGMLVDGTGAEPYKADIALLDGKIAKIERTACGANAGGGENRLCNAPAKQTIGAGGRYVTPGFIDVHRHDDAAVFKDGYGEIQLRQGITTTINGNCGLSATPMPASRRQDIIAYLRPITGSFPRTDYETFDEYLSRVEEHPLPLNFGSHIGNGTTRMAVKGFAGGALSPDEIAGVRRYFDDALNAGAFGISMGLAYTPEIFYGRESLVELLSPLRGGSVPMVTHIRGEGDMLYSAVGEVISVAEELRIPLHISHYKCLGRKNWGHLLKKTTALIQAARERGVKITVDVYPWTAGATLLTQLLPPKFVEGGMARAVERLRDAKLREECRAILQIPDTAEKFGFENEVLLIGWENVMIGSVNTAKNQECIGKRFTEIAAMRGQDPFDAACDIIIEEEGDVSMISFIADETDIISILNYDNSCVISDSIYSDTGNPHPRLYGTYTKLLAEFVRDKKALPLSTAIHKISGKPAGIFGIKNKGILKEGYDADIAVFDLARIENHATYEAPRHLGLGFDYVFVGGKIANDHDRFIDTGAGRVLRREGGSGGS